MKALIYDKQEDRFMKEITLRIFKDGTVQGETHGIKGKACLNYISILEQLTGAKCVDSDFTAEYKETPEVLRPSSRVSAAQEETVETEQEVGV